MNKILKQLDLLRELAEGGAVDEMTRLTIRKLLDDEIQKKVSLEKIPEDLAKFGKEYKMRSERFKEKLERGELEEAVEFVEWASFYQMFCRGKSKRDITPILGKIRSNQTIDKLDFLLELAKSGVVDGRMELTLKKLVEHYIQKCERDITELSQDLADFEDKYEMDSEYFYDEFESGNLGDAMDFIEWASLYQMFKRTESRKKMLEQGI